MFACSVRAPLSSPRRRDHHRPPLPLSVLIGLSVSASPIPLSFLPHCRVDTTATTTDRLVHERPQRGPDHSHRPPRSPRRARPVSSPSASPTHPHLLFHARCRSRLPRSNHPPTITSSVVSSLVAASPPPPPPSRPPSHRARAGRTSVVASLLVRKRRGLFKPGSNHCNENNTRMIFKRTPAFHSLAIELLPDASLRRQLQSVPGACQCRSLHP